MAALTLLAPELPERDFTGPTDCGNKSVLAAAGAVTASFFVRIKASCSGPGKEK